MNGKDKSASVVMSRLLTLAASSTLLITVCFAPALAQQKDQINHDGTYSHRPIAASYFA